MTIDDDSLLYPLPPGWREVLARASDDPADRALVSAVAEADIGTLTGYQRRVREAIIAWYRAVRLRPGEPWDDVVTRTLGQKPKRCT